jgi:hypothetical protein
MTNLASKLIEVAKSLQISYRVCGAIAYFSKERMQQKLSGDCLVNCTRDTPPLGYFAGGLHGSHAPFTYHARIVVAHLFEADERNNMTIFAVLTRHRHGERQNTHNPQLIATPQNSVVVRVARWMTRYISPMFSR